MKQKLRLTWNYFIEQKKDEIREFLRVVIPVFLICLTVIFCGYVLYETMCYLIVFLPWIFLVIMFILFGGRIFIWLRKNWIQAKKRAEIKLSKSKRK